MALPSTAKIFAQPMDPSDILDFAVTITKEGVGDATFPILQAGESVDSYTLAPMPEAVAAGLRIKTGAGYATTLSGSLLTLWLEIDPAMQASDVFSSGLTLGLELTVNTTSTPPRRKQRTFAVKVQQQ